MSHFSYPYSATFSDAFAACDRVRVRARRRHLIPGDALRHVGEFLADERHQDRPARPDPVRLVDVDLAHPVRRDDELLVLAEQDVRVVAEELPALVAARGELPLSVLARA
jgi:hypothetical protein